MSLSVCANPSTDHITRTRAEVLQLFVGKHNFCSYTKGDRSYVLTTWQVVFDFGIADPITLNGRQLVLRTISDGAFFRHQISTILAVVLS
jgi:tRNA U38,U39,U40 pseudouridine synthase TruA